MKKIYGFLFLLFLSFISIQGVSAATKLAECSYSFDISSSQFQSITNVDTITISVDDSGKLSYPVADGKKFTAKNGTNYTIHYKNFNGYLDALYKDGSVASSCPNLILGVNNNQKSIGIIYSVISSTAQYAKDYDSIQSLKGQMKEFIENYDNIETGEKEYCKLSSTFGVDNTPVSVRFYDDTKGKHRFEVSIEQDANNLIRRSVVYDQTNTINDYAFSMDKDWNNISSYWSNDCSKSKIYLHNPDGDPKRFYITTKEINDGSLNASTSDDNDDGSSYTDKNEQKVDPSKKSTDVTDVEINKLCQSSNLKTPIKYVGWVLTAAKIIIPILIIAMGALDFFKVMTSNKSDEIPKALRSLIMRVIAGIIIFFIPTLIHFMFSLIDDWNDYQSSYSECTKCLYNPKSC